MRLRYTPAMNALKRNSPIKGAGAVAKGSALFTALATTVSRLVGRLGRPARLAGPSLHLVGSNNIGARDTFLWERGKSKYALWRQNVKKFHLYVTHCLSGLGLRLIPFFLFS